MRLKKLAKVLSYLFRPQLNEVVDISQSELDVLCILQILCNLFLQGVLCVVGASPEGFNREGHMEVTPLIVIPLITFFFIQDETQESLVTL